MGLLQSLLFGSVSFIASIVGAICGIGGGVIIKPTLDLFGWASVSAISFLSGCTVLSMSCYSVGKSMLSAEKSVDVKTGTPLAIGAAAGGILGKQLFSAVRSMASNPSMVGGIQAICLAFISLGTLIYTVNKERIKTKKISHVLTCVLIGLLLGMMSSFLGIGGGPINLVVLYYFFSMETKIAAANSLYIILFSQITSLITSLVTKTVPEFAFISLVVMVAGGILGGVVGRRINKKIDSKAVEKLFIVLMVVIIGISLWNTYRYLIIRA